MKKEQKIAFIFSQFPCYDETFILREMNQLRAGGLEFEIYSLKSPKDKIVHDEAKELAKNTSYLPFFSFKLLKADLFFLFHHPLRYLTTFFGVLLRNLKSPNFFLKTCALWYKAVGFARLARENGITHVHGQWATYPATVAFIISKLNNIPFSFTGHAHDIYLDTTMLAFKLRRAKFVTTCTETNKTFLENIAGPSFKNKIIANYHGVELERFAGEKILHSVFTILSIGTLVDRKGFEFIIQACDILKKKGLDFKCIIAGGGPEEIRLKRMIKVLALESLIEMKGRITQEAIIPLYKEADVFVLTVKTKKHFGIPNVFIEALASKVASISTRLESIHELIQDGNTGLIVPGEDAQAVADAIEKLYRDSGLRLAMAEKGYRVVKEKFDAAKNAVRLKELFAYR